MVNTCPDTCSSWYCMYACSFSHSNILKIIVLVSFTCTCFRTLSLSPTSNHLWKFQPWRSQCSGLYSRRTCKIINWSKHLNNDLLSLLWSLCSGPKDLLTNGFQCLSKSQGVLPGARHTWNTRLEIIFFRGGDHCVETWKAFRWCGCVSTEILIKCG